MEASRVEASVQVAQVEGERAPKKENFYILRRKASGGSRHVRMCPRVCVTEAVQELPDHMRKSSVLLAPISRIARSRHLSTRTMILM